jgi:uncharacterized protein YsxB (DUF464 family)
LEMADVVCVAVLLVALGAIMWFARVVEKL